mmetsp:Transcript_10024/g.16128  ORF Transcript_10024/g.16128 Transcript_10024/m.16128 type:complete len:873 (+) Transcript_10024:114-2732(+)|eukprot:jgi/Bigna1/86407/estExt_fgenesh1_pg.C_100185
MTTPKTHVYGQQPSSSNNPPVVTAAVVTDKKVDDTPLLYDAPALYYPDGKDTKQLPFESLDVEGEFYIAQAFLTYTFKFRNTSKKKLTGLFAFPTEGTVTHFEAVFPDGRVIDTAVISKDDMKNMKQQKAKGQKESQQLAQLAEGVPDLFRVPVQGIKKNDTITITVRILETCELRPDQRYHLDLNTKFPPGIAEGTISVQFQIHTGFPRELNYYSDTHLITKRDSANGAAHFLSLTPKNVDPSPIRFSYFMPSTEIMGALIQQDGIINAWDPRGSFMLFLTPPSHTVPPFPKDVIFLVDRSGSMDGEPFKLATEALSSAMSMLNPQTDTFSLVMYDHEFKQSMASNGMLQPATPQNVTSAINYMKQNGPRGGTNIEAPLMWSLNTLGRASKEAPQRVSLKSVVLITDGCVANEKKMANDVQRLMQDPDSRYTRIHTIGLGQYCNHQFLKMLSLVGRGFNENIINISQEGIVARRTMRLMHSMANPVLSNITLAMAAEGVELYPFPIPDLFKGAPFVVAGKYTGTFPESITVQGFLPDGKEWKKTIITTKAQAIPVERVFSKARIDDLTAKYWLTDDEKIREQIIELSVQESMPSAYTTVVAYETTVDKRDKEEKERKQKKNKSPSAGKAAMIGALAVGGVLAIGAGVYLLGGSGAINATAQGVGHASTAAANAIGDLFGKAGDCCGGCCHGLFQSFDPLCGSLEPVCGSCGEVLECCNDIPCGSCGDIFGNVCDSCLQPIGNSCGPVLSGCCGEVCGVAGQVTGSCGDIIKCFNPDSLVDILQSCGSITSLGDLCQNGIGSLGDVCGSAGDLCNNLGSLGDVCGSLGNLKLDSLGDICDNCGSLFDICKDVDFSSCAEICEGICEAVTKIK